MRFQNMSKIQTEAFIFHGYILCKQRYEFFSKKYCNSLIDIFEKEMKEFQSFHVLNTSETIERDNLKCLNATIARVLVYFFMLYVLITTY
jgi:hypothetical protein